ncbi:MAG: DUF4331 domain-containing protein [Methylococcaceae bacterium]|nr:DUF4331 domain-containing protein [Methylococcaceae bacterium]
MQRKIFSSALAGLSLGLAFASANVSQAASHREAPLIAQDPAADITDVYAFRSWEDPSKIVLIMNVIPAQEPSSGPNYFFFDDQVAYDFNLDLDQDGIAEDIIYRVRFKTEIRPPFNDLPVSYAGVDPVPGLPPAITDLDGPGAAGLGLRQTYTVTKIEGQKATVLAKGLFAVPSNIGLRTMPDYEELADEGIYPLSNGGRVFAGQRDETFYIDLGATFDTLNFRAAPPILSPAQDASDFVNPFGNDMFSGFNVNTIAIEIPASELGPMIGMYASTSRPRLEIHKAGGGVGGIGNFVQVARMGNPLVNELIIGTGRKDRWNATDPKTEKQFLDFYLRPRLVAVLNLAFGTAFPTVNRTDLVAALLQYAGQDPTSCTGANRCSELLRLNTTVDPADPVDQKRLGGLAGDSAGFPNGRRPNDDVTDIVLRVAAGALLGPVPNLGDGVNFNIGAPGNNLSANGIYTIFPFLPTPFDGRDRRHIDCGEAGANPCN